MKKIIGLPNFGNTCYINTAIQLFIRCNKLIDKLKYFSNNENNIINILKNIIKSYENKNYDNYKNYILQLLNKYSKIQNIKINDQCDASLFLNYILSEISDNNEFRLLFCNIISCKCNYISFNYQHENFLTVYPNNLIQKLDNLINEKLSKSILSNYICDKCHLNENITEHNILINTGNYLFINISKIINYNSQVIPMNTFSITTPTNIEDRINNNNINDIINKFILIGFIYHSGNISYGHYVCYLKYDDKWYLCNDLHISEISLNEINNIINKATFLLYNKL